MAPAMRILVVEDEPATLELMTGVLRSFEVDVVPMIDSEEASRAINREKFDGIFLDLLMPKIDGYRLAKAVRQSNWNRTTPIVIVTGSRDRRVMQQAFHAGGNFFLSKPVDRNKLHMLLNTTRGVMLANRRGLQRAELSVPLTREDVKGSPPLWTVNISERGMLFEGDPHFRPQQEVTVSFCLPAQSDHITVTAVVARVDERGRVGIAFRTLRQTDRQRIRIYVANHRAKLDDLDAEIAREIMA